MRIALIILGVVLIVGGVGAWTGMFGYTKDKEVAKIGSLSASVQTDKNVPQWLSGLAVVAGLGLVIVGAMRKN